MPLPAAPLVQRLGVNPGVREAECPPYRFFERVWTARIGVFALFWFGDLSLFCLGIYPSFRLELEALFLLGNFALFCIGAGSPLLVYLSYVNLRLNKLMVSDVVGWRTMSGHYWGKRAGYG